MSSTDQIQDLFDSALSALPSGATPSTQSLYRRLHQRSIRTRLSTIGVSLLAIAVSATALLVGLASNSAYAVTLFPNTHGSASTAQLVADQSVMTARLHAAGFENATVKLSHGALVVTNGPKGLASPTSLLTSSPQLLVRSVTCYAGRQSGPVSTSPLPTTCSSPRYDAPTVSGFAIPTTEPDPALAAYATTTPAQDAKSRNTWALLPLLNSGTGAAQRYLVGPTLITLSSKVASATVTHVPSSGGWIVNVHLNAAESQQWNHVAKQYFHRQLAVDLNGVIVEAPLIQPANSTFVSFDGQMQLFAVSKTDAYDLAAALTSGPLAVPLVAHSSSSKASESKTTSVSSPVCQASNITLHIGATYKGGGSYPAGTLLTPVTFTNHGPACHLPMGGPTVRAVRGAYDGNATKVSQLSMPTVPATNKRIKLRSGARDQALVEVRGLPSAMLRARTCSPHTAEGFVVEGYADPVVTTHYFARSMANVCFYAGPGGIATDLGVVWAGTNS
jgi:hypothetical protein